MAFSNHDHSLPASPQQGRSDNPYQSSPAPQYQPIRPQYQNPTSPSNAPAAAQKQERVRPKSRGFSFHSEKSHKSSNSHHKIDLHETSAEKEAKRLHGTADPRAALNDLEPAMQAQEATTGAMRTSLRSLQHKDSYGNPITDPDRSNPTRNKWERPLDTIRGFEAAIDGRNYRRSVYGREPDTSSSWNKRSSYYGSEQCLLSPYPLNISFALHMNNPDNGPRFPQDSYYGARPQSGFQPETPMGMGEPRQSAMMSGPRDNYYQDGYENNPYGNGAVGGRNRNARMQSDPHLNRGVVDRNVYPMPSNHRSYETVASGSASGSYAEPMGYQTDPTSSENSSIDRRLPPKRQDPVNDYGISFDQGPQPPILGLDNSSSGPPVVPRKDKGSLLKKPSRTAMSSGDSPERSDTGEKRKSWFKRFGRS
ncbi:hypothetical protein F4779DRAFT_619563 [Xylariaceae sp. FL0662B]|nr:hypothetical protein F4779DRAFT_619563 [Xylariaceae sp. FL0662B]